MSPLTLISSSNPQVPFGKFAYMPGQLYDTNEIMVLLGDNWFVKRSVKQALEIAERRKQSECNYSITTRGHDPPDFFSLCTCTSES